MMYEFETVEAPPSGLCACTLDERPMHIAAISPRSITLRLPERIQPSGALELRLYRAENARYERHTIHTYQAGEARNHDGAVLLRLCFDEPACARAIRRMLGDYARCLEIKSTLGTAAYAEYVCGYPADGDEVFYSSLQQQFTAWFAHLPPLPPPQAGISCALRLNCPELWDLYLQYPLADFMIVYAERRYLPRNFLQAILPDRLYIGNPYCAQLFPDTDKREQICRKAIDEGLCITVSAAPPACGQENHAEALTLLAEKYHGELEVNDWGMLHRASGRIPLLLGPLLNRRRKDPRAKYKPGFDPALWMENSLNFPAWLQYLQSQGVIRLEYEACGPVRTPDDLPCSLQFPFYQTNTSHWCPLEAICLRKDRGAQRPSDACARWCEGNALLYPTHLNMIGRWNSLLALGDMPDAAVSGDFDRWVLNF